MSVPAGCFVLAAAFWLLRSARKPRPGKGHPARRDFGAERRCRFPQRFGFPQIETRTRDYSKSVAIKTGLWCPSPSFLHYFRPFFFVGHSIHQPRGSCGRPATGVWATCPFPPPERRSPGGRACRSWGPACRWVDCFCYLDRKSRVEGIEVADGHRDCGCSAPGVMG